MKKIISITRSQLRGLVSECVTDILMENASNAWYTQYEMNDIPLNDQYTISLRYFGADNLSNQTYWALMIKNIETNTTVAMYDYLPQSGWQQVAGRKMKLAEMLTMFNNNAVNEKINAAVNAINEHLEGQGF